MNPEDIARVCHEANRALQIIQCQNGFGIPVASPWDDFAEQAGVIAGVKTELEHPEYAAADMHEAWCEFKRAEGWVYGPVKNADAKTHPCLVPYHELPVEQRIKDHLFSAIVGALS